MDHRRRIYRVPAGVSFLRLIEALPADARLVALAPPRTDRNEEDLGLLISSATFETTLPGEQYPVEVLEESDARSRPRDL